MNGRLNTAILYSILCSIIVGVFTTRANNGITIQGSKFQNNSFAFNQNPAEKFEARRTEAKVVKHNLTRVVPSNGSDPFDDTICNVRTITRKSFLHKVDVEERQLSCSRLRGDNYQQFLLNRSNSDQKSDLNQIHLIECDTSIIGPALHLICASNNCSRLTVVNVTGRGIMNEMTSSSWNGSQYENLEVLSFSNLTLRSIDPVTTLISRVALKNLTALHLDNNNLSELNFDRIFEIMPNLKYYSMLNNSVFSVVCTGTCRETLTSQLDVISLAGSAISCDKNHLWFMKIFSSTAFHTKFPNYDQIKCGSPEKLAEMSWSHRISVLDNPVCDLCDCNTLKKAAIAVDCNNKNLTSLPTVLPWNTKVLNLTGNRIDTIGVPYNSKNWDNVTYVYLENNVITSFQPHSSKFLRNLAFLDIRRNKLQEFPSHIFERFVNLDQVQLSNNPWLCECESTFAFQEWLQRQFHKVTDKEEIMCGVPGHDENGLKSYGLHQRLSSRIIYRLSKSELCPQESLEDPYDWLSVVNFILGFTILLVLLKVTLDYIYQYRTKRLPHFFKLNL